MAKRKPRCKKPHCIPCNWWPKIVKLLGKDQGCFWVDETTGEVFIATGIRSKPDGQGEPIVSDEGFSFFEGECECGDTFAVREDLMDRGLTGRCPHCASVLAALLRN